MSCNVFVSEKQHLALDVLCVFVIRLVCTIERGYEKANEENGSSVVNCGNRRLLPPKRVKFVRCVMYRVPNIFSEVCEYSRNVFHGPRVVERQLFNEFSRVKFR